MKSLIIVLILALNVFSIISIVKMVKGYDSKIILGFVLAGEIGMFIICNILYALSSLGIPSNVHQASKWLIVFTMLPVNIITIYCPVIKQINKKSFNEITEEKLKKRMSTYIIIAFVLLIIETIYVKNIQSGISNFNKP